MKMRKWLVDYTLPGQTLQRMEVQATNMLTARQLVQSMLPRALVGYIREITG